MSKKFEQQLAELDITLTQTQFNQFDKYYEMLVEWNKVMNLTGITEYEEVNEKHFVDSLALVKALDISKVQTVIDIGTGAGFPGIPLKIAFPHLKITLLDSLNKRIRFLDSVIEELNLTDIHTIHGRAEDFARQADYREQFDLCVSRAVANLSTLSEYCLPYVKVGGFFVSYKSGDIVDELSAAKTANSCHTRSGRKAAAKTAVHVLGGTQNKPVVFQLPGSDISRSFVKIKKIKPTGKKFPRKAGLPSKEPIHG